MKPLCLLTRLFIPWTSVIVVIAVVQGAVTGIIMALGSTPHVIPLTLLAMLLSIIPGGAAFVAVPVGIVHLMSGNFVLERNEDGSWLIDSVKLRPTKETMNPFSFARWKGRVLLSMKSGFKISSLLRYDWTTDYLILIFFMAAVLTNH